MCGGARKIPDTCTVEDGKMFLKTNEDNVSSTTFSIPQFSDGMYAVVCVLVDADVIDMFVVVAVDVSADC